MNQRTWKMGARSSLLSIASSCRFRPLDWMVAAANFALSFLMGGVACSSMLLGRPRLMKAWVKADPSSGIFGGSVGCSRIWVCSAAGGAGIIFSHSARGMGGLIGKFVFGCRPDLRTFSCPTIPPAFHFPSFFLRHGRVRSFGAVSA